MSDTVIKSVKKQAVQLAKNVAKQGTAEILGNFKDAHVENAATKDNRPSPIVEAMRQTGGHEGPTVSGLKRVNQIEDEMARLRQMRKQEQDSQQKISSETPERLSEPGKPILPSSPQRGAKLSRPQKQKTQIESKSGKN